jgi:hypothetical protein
LRFADHDSENIELLNVTAASGLSIDAASVDVAQAPVRENHIFSLPATWTSGLPKTAFAL